MIKKSDFNGTLKIWIARIIIKHLQINEISALTATYLPSVKPSK